MNYRQLYTLACIELALRWVNDRAEEQRQRRIQRAKQDPSGRWFG